MYPNYAKTNEKAVKALRTLLNAAKDLTDAEQLLREQAAKEQPKLTVPSDREARNDS